MSEVKRYSFWPQIVHLPGGGGVRAEVHFKVEEDGLFVAHQDYASLKAENEELHKDYEALADEHTKLTNRKLLEDYARLKAELTDRKDEADRLKAEVERLTQAHSDALADFWAIHKGYFDLKAEVERLRASSFVTAVPVEQYERVVKAGDALVFCMNLNSPSSGNALRSWNAAKEGKPSV